MTVVGPALDIERREAVVPVGLAVTAAAVTWASAASVPFPLNEGSAYYVTVARNLVDGPGLVVDAHLELLHAATCAAAAGVRAVAAAGQPDDGHTDARCSAQASAGAQLAYVVLGAVLAPLVWLLARQAAAQLALPSARANWVALGAGALAALSGPLLFAAAVPDSTLPFAVLGVAACLAVPRAAHGERRMMVALGVILGLAYLTRMEAIYLGLTFALFAAAAGVDLRTWLTRVTTAAAVGALVVLPWWLRNLGVFGTPFPTQIGDNLWLTRNELIFGYLVHPSFAGFAAQGIGGIAGNVVNAMGFQLVDTLLVPGGLAVAVGLVAAVAGAWTARRPSGPRRIARSSLGAVLVSGTVTFLATAVLFPVATLWGTFSHAAGPLLVGLLVAAVLGLDEVIERVGRRRGWQRNNAWLAPCALIALTLPITLLQVSGAARQSRDESQVISQLASTLPAALDAAHVPARSPVITNRPIWLSDALGRSTLALPARAAAQCPSPGELLWSPKRRSLRLVPHAAAERWHNSLLHTVARRRCR